MGSKPLDKWPPGQKLRLLDEAGRLNLHAARAHHVLPLGIWEAGWFGGGGVGREGSTPLHLWRRMMVCRNLSRKDEFVSWRREMDWWMRCALRLARHCCGVLCDGGYVVVFLFLTTAIS